MKCLFFILLLAVTKTVYTQPPYEPIGASPSTISQWDPILTNPVVDSYLDRHPMEINPPICYNVFTWNSNPGVLCSNWTAWSYITPRIVIEHPNFPGCLIIVNAYTRQCITNPRIVALYIADWEILEGSITYCSTLKDYIESGSAMEQGEKANQMDVDLYRITSKKLYQDYINGLIALEEPLPPCDQEDFNFFVHFYKESCTAYCRSIFPIDVTKEGVRVTSVSCNNEFCCKFVERFCTDDYGNVLQFEHRSTEIYTNCTIIPPPITSCPLGAIVTSITDCVNPCSVNTNIFE